MEKSLASLPLFQNIEDLPALLDRCEERKYRKGDILLHRGEKATKIGLVLSGTIHIIREDFWGNRGIVGLAGPGDIFAESYYLGNAVLEVTVLAASDVRVLFLDTRQVKEPQLTENLLTLMAGKNRMLTEKMRHMARRTTREKLLSYLSAQALRAGGPEFDIPLDRQQLADYLGVERSAMSATLCKLRDEGALKFRRNHFHLLRQDEED